MRLTTRFHRRKQTLQPSLFPPRRASAPREDLPTAPSLPRPRHPVAGKDLARPPRTPFLARGQRRRLLRGSARSPIRRTASRRNRPQSCCRDRSVPPNRLTTDPLDRTLSSEEPSTAGDYGTDDDVTPITSPGQPVESSLTGLQTPTIAVEKFAPRGSAGRQAGDVRDRGQERRQGARLRRDRAGRGPPRHEIPPGHATSHRKPKGAGSVGSSASSKPGQEKVIELQLVPEMEGEIGSVAQVTFQSKAGSKSIVTQPKLAITPRRPASRSTPATSPPCG